MAWWNRLFKKKEPIQQEEDWEQLVYTRNGVNFDEEDQRKRYIVNCLEQIAEASKEIDLLTGEYTLVTSYLTDTRPCQQSREKRSTGWPASWPGWNRNAADTGKRRTVCGMRTSMRSAKERTRLKKAFRRFGTARNTAI